MEYFSFTPKTFLGDPSDPFYAEDLADWQAEQDAEREQTLSSQDAVFDPFGESDLMD